MAVEVIGIEHVFVAVRDMERSEEFYDRVMAVLGFRKGRGPLAGDPHVFYHNRQVVYALRPASEGSPDHDPYAPGLHHLCFRAARELAEAGVEATAPATTRNTVRTTTPRSSRTPTA